MELRTCSKCNTVVDIESTPVRPTRVRFGNVKQRSSRCPRCDTIVAAVLHEEDAEANYLLDAAKLTPDDAKELAKGKKRLRNVPGVAKSTKPIKEVPLADVETFSDFPADEE